MRTSSKSTDKLELLTTVASAFITSGALKEFTKVEVDVTWDSDALPNIKIKLEK